MPITMQRGKVSFPWAHEPGSVNGRAIHAQAQELLLRLFTIRCEDIDTRAQTWWEGVYVLCDIWVGERRRKRF